MKKFIILFMLIFLVGCTKQLSGDPLTTKIDSVKQIEGTKVKGNKYTQIMPEKVGNYTIHVDEYITPDGTPGYQIWTYETRADGTYVKSEAVGKDAKDKTWDWIKLDTERITK
jgi:hypothetical protein